MLRIFRKTIVSSITPISSKSSSLIDMVQIPRTGPFSAVYRAALSVLSSSKEPCKNFRDNYCQVAANSFGLVGQTYYTFNNSQNNIQGNSIQVILSCRCIDPSCERAILMRSVNVERRDGDERKTPSNRTVFLYQAVDGKLSDCHSELFNITNPSKASSFSNSKSTGTKIVYPVIDPFHQDYWTATRYSGLQSSCVETEIENLPTIDLSSLIASDINSTGRYVGLSGGCKPPPGIQYYRATGESDEDKLSDLYSNATRSAKTVASQQDCYSIGKRPIAYMRPRSIQLISDTELALVCSSAVLGILLLWSMLRKLMHNREEYTRFIIAGILFQVVLSYILEALPLHAALVNEIRAEKWYSPLAFADATYTHMNRDGKRDGVLMFIIDIGEARFLRTRVSLVACLSAFFTFVAIGIGSVIIYRVVRIIRN